MGGLIVRRTSLPLFFREPFGWFGGFPWEESAMRIAVKEGDNQAEVEAELPGFTPDEVDLQVDSDLVMISANHKEERKEDKTGYVRQERFTHGYSRSVVLPHEVDESAVTAKLENGVLRITLPYRETKSATKVVVN